MAVRSRIQKSRTSPEPGPYVGGKPGPRGNVVLDLERYIPALLIFLANKYTRRISASIRKRTSIGTTEWRIIALLAIEEWITPSRIVEVIGYDKAAVSRSIRVLEEQGLLDIRAHEEKSRWLHLNLTPAGRKLHDQLILIAFQNEQELLACLTKSEIEVLIKLLNRMHRALPFTPVSEDEIGGDSGPKRSGRTRKT